MRRDLFMGKLNPEKVIQRLQDINKCLDYIPIERTSLRDKKGKHMESHCQKMKSGQLWDEQCHLNGK
jgi:hypothetical protein